MALIDDKTWSLYNSFKKLTMEFLVRNTSSYYHIVSMEKLALAHIIPALSAFSRNGVHYCQRTGRAYYVALSPLLLLQKADLFFWALSVFPVT